MTIIFSQDPTGPTPYEDEILQIGAVFATDDLEEVHERFGSYIRPRNVEDVKRSAIARTGIPDKSWIAEDPPFGTPHVQVWPHFRDVAERHGSGLEGARLLCFDAAYDAPYLRHSVEEVDAPMPAITRFIGGLVQATVDVCSYQSYLGETPDVLDAIRDHDLSVNQVRSAVFDHYDVSCNRMTDAVRRADAIRHSYRALFRKLNNTDNGKSRRSGRQRSTPVTRRR